MKKILILLLSTGCNTIQIDNTNLYKLNRIEKNDNRGKIILSNLKKEALERKYNE